MKRKCPTVILFLTIEFHYFMFFCSGSLDLHGFHAILKDLGIELTQSDLMMSFMAVDTNSDGRIYWDDFVNWFSDLKKLSRN